MRHTKTSYKLISLALCLTMLLPLAGCGESKQEQAEIFAMDTYMTLTAYGKNATAGLNAAKSVITSMDSMLDPELETSTTYAINHAEGASVVVPGQVARMLNTAQAVYKQSGGALDLTIYPLIKRWGFVDGKYYVPSTRRYRPTLPSAALTSSRSRASPAPERTWFRCPPAAS